VQGYIEAGKKEGAVLAAGGVRVGSKGYFLRPTVFANVTENMKIAREEIFGPVMSILEWSDEEDVI
jgi:acyl-CoA reductase-like NAD-dependent aldehyde dehydrogenase